jgi:nucleotide-binding universal stress UspA family protein
MKIMPNRREPGSVVVELGPNERAIPGVAPERSLAPLPIFALRRILVPVDFSDCSKKALQYATPLAKQFNAELTVLHVVEPYLAFCPEIPLCEMPTPEAARVALDDLALEVPFKAVVRMGEPHAQIVAAADELAIDLIVLSTHGRTGMAHVFMGSTAEKVVRHATCPVLIVRQQEREFAEQDA